MQWGKKPRKVRVNTGLVTIQVLNNIAIVTHTKKAKPMSLLEKL